MNESKYTSGPWTRDGLLVYALYQISAKQGAWNNRFTAQIEYRQGCSGTGEIYGCPIEEAQANARLIAAAPDLLEALERCEQILAFFTDEGNWRIGHALDANSGSFCGTIVGSEAFTAARAAIAKAKGQS